MPQLPSGDWSQPVDSPNAEQLAEFAESPAAFRSCLMVDTGDSIAPFIPDPWQVEDFAKIDPLWLRAVGASDVPELPRGWVGRARGHSKTTDQAMMVMWALIFSTRPIKGVVAAAAEKQAQILLERITTLVMLNPWINEVLNINKFNVSNIDQTSDAYSSNMDIISSDAPKQFGMIADFVVCDELTHWQNEKLWTALSSTAGKRQRCLLLVMTNAGIIKSWQHKLLEYAKGNGWAFIHHDGPVASWVNEKMLAEQRGIIPSRKEFNRLWLNKWQLEMGDCLEEDDIRAAVNENLHELRGRELGWQYVAGLDLSTRRDRSALVVLGANQEQHRIRLAYARSWKPMKDGLVPLDRVKEAVLLVHTMFACDVYYDPTQAEWMMQEIRRIGLNAMPMSFQSSKNCDLMSSRLMETFKGRRIELYPDEELIQSLFNLNIVPKRFGYKLEAERTSETGHADKAFALAIALPAAVELAGTYPLNVFVDHSIAQTLDELLQKQHNLDKAAQEEILGKIEKAVCQAQSGVGELSRQRADDTRSVLVKALEENVITFGEEMDAA